MKTALKNSSHIQVFLWFWKSMYVNIYWNDNKRATLQNYDIFRIYLNDFICWWLCGRSTVLCMLHCSQSLFSLALGLTQSPTWWVTEAFSTGDKVARTRWRMTGALSVFPVCLNDKYRVILIMSLALSQLSVCIHGLYIDNYGRTQISMN